MSGRTWERREEDALLQARPGELPALARRLARSVSGVRSKHSRTCPGHREVYWSEREVKVLRRLWRNGLPLADIGKATGRPRDAVRSKVRALGMPKRRDLRPWTEAEIAAVRHPGADLIQDVAAALGRSRDGAYAQRRRSRHGSSSPAAR